MKTLPLVEVKNNLSRYLAYVRRGGRVTIYNRDTPVAELAPPPASVEGTHGEVLARLEREGVIRRGTGRLFPELLKPPRGRSAEGEHLSPRQARRDEDEDAEHDPVLDERCDRGRVSVREVVRRLRPAELGRVVEPAER